MTDFPPGRQFGIVQSFFPGCHGLFTLIRSAVLPAFNPIGHFLQYPG
jgi:hypothetical protein